MGSKYILATFFLLAAINLKAQTPQFAVVRPNGKNGTAGTCYRRTCWSAGESPPAQKTGHYRYECLPDEMGSLCGCKEINTAGTFGLL